MLAPFDQGTVTSGGLQKDYPVDSGPTRPQHRWKTEKLSPQREAAVLQRHSLIRQLLNTMLVGQERAEDKEKSWLTVKIVWPKVENKLAAGGGGMRIHRRP